MLYQATWILVFIPFIILLNEKSFFVQIYYNSDSDVLILTEINVLWLLFSSVVLLFLIDSGYDKFRFIATPLLVTSSMLTLGFNEVDAIVSVGILFVFFEYIRNNPTINLSGKMYSLQPFFLFQLVYLGAFVLLVAYTSYRLKAENFELCLGLLATLYLLFDIQKGYSFLLVLSAFFFIYF